MAVRPILFSAPMVLALLARRKYQTRRLAEPNWAVGDILWVREAFSGPWRLKTYRPGLWPVNVTPIWYWADGNPPEGDWTPPKPSIHMPAWASRINLRVTGIRSERLQTISERDAIAEGLEVKGADFMPYFRGAADLPWRPEFPVDAYRDLWTKLNGPTSWDEDPLVWVTEFDLIGNPSAP